MGRRAPRPRPAEESCAWLVGILIDRIDRQVSAGLQEWHGNGHPLEALINSGELLKIVELAAPEQRGELLVAWAELSGHPAAKAIGEALQSVKRSQDEEWLRGQLEGLRDV